MKAFGRSSLPLLLYCLCTQMLWAGGSGLNVVVVVNQNSANSVELGNYYCEKRQVPPQNVLRIHWGGNTAAWNAGNFNTYLVNPLLELIASRQLTNQVDYVVLSMDIPYRVVEGGGVTTAGMNSTTAAVYYGFKPDGPGNIEGYTSCNLPDVSSNSYAGSEAIFRNSPPSTAPTNSFLTMMITSSNLAQAKAIVDRGVMSDATFPAQPVVLAKTSDGFRNIRHLSFDNAIFDTRLRGNYLMVRTNSDTPDGLTNLLGYETGLAQFSISPNEFVPGAMADSLTSFAGILYEPSDQTTLLAFLDAGATASYGTIVEPCAYFEKFPSSQTYFYQSRGFNVAECYYQGVTNPFQGNFVGEPLSAPFGLPASGSWLGLPLNSELSGTTNLSLAFVAPDSLHPIQQVDMFVDGQWQQTLTSIAPAAGNLLTVTINGHTANYEVPDGASLGAIATGLAVALNSPAVTNGTKVIAFVHGDRIELQAIDRSKLGEQVSLTASSSIGNGAALTTSVSAILPEFLDTTASGLGTFTVLGDPTGTTVLTNTSYLRCVVTKLNLSQVTLGVTNTSGNQTVTQMGQQLADLINNASALQTPDGLSALDFIINYSPPPDAFLFNLVARSPSWNAAQIRVALTGSSEFNIQPSVSGRLDDNLLDLRPRNHLYVTAGVTNLPLTFNFDTTALANGFHELTAVAYEGSHVRTQSRTSQVVRIRNAPLDAVLSLLNSGTNVGLSSIVQFSVAANTNDVNSIQLFSTGGLVASSTNQALSVLSIEATSLGVGLHPFYALITSPDGTQFRTATTWVRITEAIAPFPLTITGIPTALSWPAVIGQSYDILTSTNLADPFQLEATLTASNSPVTWIDPNPPASQRFYRVQTSN